MSADAYRRRFFCGRVRDRARISRHQVRGLPMCRQIAALLFATLVSIPASAITRNWTGATSANWSDPSNWSPAAIPTAADTLVFPAGARLAMTNDLPAGTSVGPMTFNDNY